MYQRGKIYKIICNVTNKCYVGSTCEPTVAHRLTKHKANYKKYLNNNYNYVTSFDILQNNNYEIVLIENYPCNSKDELHARERHWIETLECVNKVIPTRTRAEYREATKEHIKEYYQQTKEKVRAKDKIKHNCECGGRYVHSRKAAHFKTIKHQNYLSTVQDKVIQ